MVVRICVLAGGRLKCFFFCFYVVLHFLVDTKCFFLYHGCLKIDYHLHPCIFRPHRNTQTARIYMRRNWWLWQINQMTLCSPDVNILRIIFIAYWSSTDGWQNLFYRGDSEDMKISMLIIRNCILYSTILEQHWH